MNPRVVTDEMGHSKTSITLDVYAHVFGGGRDEVRRTVYEYVAATPKRRSRADEPARQVSRGAPR